MSGLELEVDLELGEVGGGGPGVIGSGVVAGIKVSRAVAGIEAQLDKVEAHVLPGFEVG